MNTALPLMTLCAVCLFFGYKYGQWKTERESRLFRESMEHSRIMISVPVGREDAAKTMEMIADFLRKVQESEDNSNPGGQIAANTKGTIE